MKSLVKNVLDLRQSKGKKSQNGVKKENLQSLSDETVQSIINRPKTDNSVFDNLVKDEKNWIQDYPQGREWRDIKDQVIDDRDYSSSFKSKLKTAQQFMQYLNLNKKAGLLGFSPVHEAQEKIFVELCKVILDEVVEELLFTLINDITSLKNRSLDLMSKMILNGITNINEGNKRYLKQTGKIALLRGATVDFTLNKNDFMGDQSRQEKMFDSTVVYDIDKLAVLRKLEENLSKERSKIFKPKIEKLHLFNASFPLDLVLQKLQARLEIDYWENVNFKPILPFHYDNNYGKITVVKQFSDPSFAELGSIVVAGTSLGRILVWKVTFNPNQQGSKPASPSRKSELKDNKNKSSRKTMPANRVSQGIELIASNEKQKGLDALPILDLKLPSALPNTIVAMNNKNIINVWNLQFILNEGRFDKEKIDFYDKNSSNMKSLLSLFNCFSYKKFNIIIHKVYSIFEDDLSYQPYFSLKNYELYPEQSKTSFQQFMENMQGQDSSAINPRTSTAEISATMGITEGTKRKLLHPSTTFKVEKEILLKEGKILKTTKDEERNFFIDRHVPVTFAHFRHLGFREGEPESILVGTNDGLIFKINLDLLGKLADDNPRQQHLSNIPVNSTKDEYPPTFVDKEFMNPNIAPDGFVLAIQNKNELQSNNNETKTTNLVFRELFKFHENPILILESFTVPPTTTTNNNELKNNFLQEMIISLDNSGKIALWKYSSDRFRGSAWFVPEMVKQFSFTAIDYEKVSESSYQEFDEKALNLVKILTPILIDKGGRPANQEEDKKNDPFTLPVNPVIPLKINSSTVYYPIYHSKEKNWIQYEIVEGQFKKSSVRATTNNGSPSPQHRKSSAFLIASGITADGKNISPRSASIADSPREGTILASKVASKLRNTVISTFNAKKAIKETVLKPKVVELDFIKAIITDDKTELILLFQKPSTDDKSYHFYSILTKNLTCSHPSCEVKLISDEIIIDFVVTSIFEETCSRNILLLTNRRILIYSFANEEITTKLTTKPLFTLQKVMKDFQIPDYFFPEKLCLCPSNKVLVIVSSKKPFLCFYQLDIKGMAILNTRDEIQSSLKENFENYGIPWYRSEDELRRIAVKTFSESASIATSGSIESLIEDIHEYAVSLALDGIIGKLEKEHEEFQKSVMKTFFKDNLGFIPPTTWPAPESQPNKQVEKRPLTVQSSDSSLSNESNKPTEEKKEPSEIGDSTERKKSASSEAANSENIEREEIELIMNEMIDRLEATQRLDFTVRKEIELIMNELIDRLRAKKELDLLIQEEIEQRSLAARVKEMSLMAKEDIRVVKE
jgi:hypothetical protein